MKKIILSIFLIVIFWTLFAKSYEVKVKNNIFIPDSLSVEVGDTVVWKNIEGWHNVNASKEKYPKNPDYFQNKVSSKNWKFIYIFKKTGIYSTGVIPITNLVWSAKFMSKKKRNDIFIVGLGGAIGSICRYLLTKTISISYLFPYGTFFVNVIGSFFIGFFYGLFEEGFVQAPYKAFLTIGFLGAFTTFSTYSIESVNMLFSGQYRLAVQNILANNIFSILMTFAGIILSKYILSKSF